MDVLNSCHLPLFKVPVELIELAKHNASEAEAKIRYYQDRITESSALSAFRQPLSACSKSTKRPHASVSDLDSSASSGFESYHCNDEHRRIKSLRVEDTEDKSNKNAPGIVGSLSNGVKVEEPSSASYSNCYFVPSDSSDEEIEPLDFLHDDPDVPHDEDDTCELEKISSNIVFNETYSRDPLNPIVSTATSPSEQDQTSNDSETDGGLAHERACDQVDDLSNHTSSSTVVWETESQASSIGSIGTSLESNCESVRTELDSSLACDLEDYPSNQTGERKKPVIRTQLPLEEPFLSTPSLEEKILDENEQVKLVEKSISTSEQVSQPIDSFEDEHGEETYHSSCKENSETQNRSCVIL